MILKQNTAYTRLFLLVSSADHITGLTGASPTVQVSKSGAAFVTINGSVSQVGNGVYAISLATLDVNTIGDLAFNVTATGADPSTWVDQVQQFIFNDLVFASSTTGPGISSNVKKAQALTGFMFVMTDAITHLPKTGLTVSAQISKDAGPFAATANAPTEVGNGVYTINLQATETNANNLALIFSATGADTTYNVFLTQP